MMQSEQGRIVTALSLSLLAFSMLGVAGRQGLVPAHAAGGGLDLAQAQDPGSGPRAKAPASHRAAKRREPPAKPKPPAVADDDATLLLRTGSEGAGQAVASSGPDAPVGAAAMPTALQHARSARVSRCAPLIGQATHFTSGAASGTLSQWSSDRPDEHMFQALIGLGAGATATPHSAVVVVASPEGDGCDATVVQVRPVAQSCAEIEGGLRRSGATLTNLSGLAVAQGAGTIREMLVPVPGAGCVIVGTGLALNK